MRKEEIWAIPHERIRSFFEAQPEAEAADSGFLFPGCRVTLTALEPRQFAGMSLSQTRVVFDGVESSVIPVYRRFLLRFLSAGG